MRRPTNIRFPRPRLPRAGTVLGVIAVTAALAGTASAALPGNNQVFSTDIVNGQVRAPYINTGAVRAAEIATNAVTATEINAGAVGTSEIADGNVRAPDMGTITSRQVVLSIPPGTANFAIASCNAGEIVISGSTNMSPINDPDVALTGSFKQSNTTWEGGGANNDGVAHDLVVTAHCLAP